MARKAQSQVLDPHETVGDLQRRLEAAEGRCVVQVGGETWSIVRKKRDAFQEIVERVPAGEAAGGGTMTAEDADRFAVEEVKAYRREKAAKRKPPRKTAIRRR